MTDRRRWNAARFDASARGHYESYFQRANHPTEPRAFWIRYTVFSPKGRPQDAIGELWAIYFDRRRDHIVAVRETHSVAACEFSTERLDTRIGAATLDARSLVGAASCGDHHIAWNLEYTSPQEPLLLLPESLYSKRLPKAKALVGSPMAVFSGSLTVDGSTLEIESWVGSQNHNWGSKHTDAYAWGQVAGFDDAPDVFLECSTARVKIGPIWTPRLTIAVVRIGSVTLALNSIGQALRARGSYELFRWRFESRRKDVSLRGEFEASSDAFVGLTYLNPPGGTKTCLNSKIARCELVLERAGKRETYSTESRAAFEILTDDDSHGVPVLEA